MTQWKVDTQRDIYRRQWNCVIHRHDEDGSEVHATGSGNSEPESIADAIETLLDMIADEFETPKILCRQCASEDVFAIRGSESGQIYRFVNCRACDHISQDTESDLAWLALWILEGMRTISATTGDPQ